MNGTITTPETDGVPTDPNAIPYTGYKYTTAITNPDGVTFFPSLRQKWTFVNATYHFVDQIVPRIVGYNTTEQNVTLPNNGGWQIQNVTEPVYDGNTTIKVYAINQTAYYQYQRNPQAFWDSSSYSYYYDSQRAAPRYQITLNLTAPNGVESRIVFPLVTQTLGADYYTYQAAEPEDNNWMSRICVRVKEITPPGTYVLDTNDLYVICKICYRLCVGLGVVGCGLWAHIWMCWWVCCVGAVDTAMESTMEGVSV